MKGKSLATHVLLFYWQSIGVTFRYPVAFFMTKTASAADMSVWISTGATLLSHAGFDVKFLLSDGGSSNRSLYAVCQARLTNAAIVRAGLPSGRRR